MRRFEQLLAKPVRFWEVDVSGTVVRTREGAPGQEPVEATETLASPAAATKHADAAIAARKRDGYVEITRVAPASVLTRKAQRREQFEWVDGYVRRRIHVYQDDLHVRTWVVRIVRGESVEEGTRHEQRLHDIDAADDAFEAAVVEARARARSRAPHTLTTSTTKRDRFASHPELEAQCVAAGEEDPAPWMVYADWLISEGDLRGEIAALATTSEEQVEAAIETHYGQLYLRETDRVAYTARHGFVRRARLQSTERLSALIGDVLGSPLCRFVDAIELDLRITRDGNNDWEPAVRAVLGTPRAPELRELVIDSFEHVDITLRDRPWGDLSFAWPELPALERLDIRSRATGRLGDLGALPRLRALIRGPAVGHDEMTELLAIKLAALEHLELGVSNCDPEQLASLLDGRRFPRLGHLGLHSADLTPALIEVIARSALLPRLYSLDLSGGTLDDEREKVLASHAKRFRHLACLELTENCMRDRGEVLSRVLDNLLVGVQRWVDDDERYDDVDE